MRNIKSVATSADRRKGAVLQFEVGYRKDACRHCGEYGSQTAGGNWGGGKGSRTVGKRRTASSSGFIPRALICMQIGWKYGTESQWRNEGILIE
jgi:hypothetical protein